MNVRYTHFTVVSVLFFVVSALFLLLTSFSTSMLFHAPSIDSDTFQLMGLNILHGRIPYVDLFDHKGPVLYLFEALGLSISLTWGVWLLQTFALTITTLLWYQSLSLLLHKQWQIGTCLLVGYFMLIAYESGNMTEDWSLPFISYVIYVSLKAILYNSCKVPLTHLIGFGICFSAVSFIRVNNIFSCLGFVLYILFYNVQKERYMYILKAFTLCIVGFVIPTLCIIVWFYSIGGVEAVEEMYFGTISFNLAYMAKTSGCDSIFAMKSLAPLIFFVLLILLRLKCCKEIIIPAFLSYLLGMMVIGGSYYRHYFIIFIPLILLSIAMVFSMKNMKRKTTLLSLSLIICFITAINPLLRLANFFSFQSWKDYQSRMVQFSGIAQQKDIQSSSIWIYDAPEAIDLLIANNLVPCNKLILSHLPIFSDHLEREIGTLNQSSPEFVLKMTTSVIFDSHDQETLENDYSLVGSTHISISEKNVSLYRHKQTIENETYNK